MSRALRIRIRGHEGDLPALQDTATFLNDVNLLYETSVLVSQAYRGVRRPFSSPFYFARNARRLKPEHRLRVERLRQESPIELQTIVLVSGAVISGVVGILAAYEKIAKVHLEKRKLQIDVGRGLVETQKLRIDVAKGIRELRKLELEVEKLEDERSTRHSQAERDLLADFDHRLEETGGAKVRYEQIAKRLEVSAVSIDEIDVEEFGLTETVARRLRHKPGSED